MNGIAWMTLICVALSQCSTSQPARQPACIPEAPSATQPADAPRTQPVSQPVSQPAVDPAVRKILEDLQAAGDKYDTLRADVTMEVVDRLTGDSEQRTGWLAYQKAQGDRPAMFRVHFDTLKQGAGRLQAVKLDHAYDGVFWTFVNHNIKNFSRYQVEAKHEAMLLGKGPFPLPFGQKTEEILTYYRAETRPLEPDEPTGTTYLKLIARRERYKELIHTRVEMWIDPANNLPVQIVSRDKKKKTVKVSFREVKTNIPLEAKKLFHMERLPGYSYSVEPL